jgi:hypothetical protein
VVLNAAFVERFTTHPPKGSELAEALAQATPGTILLLTPTSSAPSAAGVRSSPRSTSRSTCA